MTQNKSNVPVSRIIILILSFKVTNYDQTKILFYLEFHKTFNFNSTVLQKFTLNQYFIIYILISIMNSKWVSQSDWENWVMNFAVILTWMIDTRQFSNRFPFFHYEQFSIRYVFYAINCNTIDCNCCKWLIEKICIFRNTSLSKSINNKTLTSCKMTILFLW